MSKYTFTDKQKQRIEKAHQSIVDGLKAMYTGEKLKQRIEGTTAMKNRLIEARE